MRTSLRLNARRARLLCAAAALLFAAAGRPGPTVQAQGAGPDTFFVTGRSVNTLGPVPFGPNPMLAGNPTHKQRNESSCDVSSYNQLVVLCAYNDYRGIPLFSDSWIGLSMSTDGGRTWKDRLLEGFPAAPMGIGAADPIVKIVPGLALVAYITIDSATSRGTLTVARLLERNKENGEPYQYLDKYVIDVGTPGRFLDKPGMTAWLDLINGGTVDVGGLAIPKGRLHYAYALFTGGGASGSGSTIYHTYSDTYGVSWSTPKKLSESLGRNQGVDVAVDDATGTVIATWRQVADGNEHDGIVMARSTDGGQTWSKAKNIVTHAVPGEFFDQETKITQFRTLSMPTIVHDGSAFHVFWSERGHASHLDDARIVRSSSATGNSWPAPIQVSPFAGRGHQIVPQAAIAGGRMQVNWIDTRNNDPGSFARFIEDYRFGPDGTRIAIDAVPPGPNDPPQYIYRNTGDIFGVQSAVGASPAFSTAQPISRYRFGLVNRPTGPQVAQLEYNFLNARMFRKGTTPFHGDYHTVAGQRYRQNLDGTWSRNTTASTSHSVFYSAFTDNRDVQGYVWAGLGASSYTAVTGGTSDGESGEENLAVCTPSENTEALTVYTPNDSPRSRFQNIYVAPTYPGLVVMSPSASKPASTGLERAYVVFAQNLTPETRVYSFTIDNQPTGGRASFRPSGATAFTESCEGIDCRQLTVTIPRGSSATRTVYVTSTESRPRILVSVVENGGQSGSVILNGMPADMVIQNPDALIGLPDLAAAEGYQPDILSRSVVYFTTNVVNPDLTPVSNITNTSIEYPRDQYPRDQYPRDQYPRDQYPRDQYPRDQYPRDQYTTIEYPRDQYPRDQYPRDQYSRLQNSTIAYSPLTGDATGYVPTTSVADITWPVVTGDGANTMTAISAKMFLNGTIPPECSATVTTNCLKGVQLLAWVPNFYTSLVSCSGERATVFQNRVILNNIISPADLAPVLEGPNSINPPLSQPTFSVGPKQVVFMTLRLMGVFTEQTAQTWAARTGAVVRSQADISDLDESNDDIDGTIDVTAPTLNLGDTSVYASVEGNTPGGANLTVSVTATDDNGSASVTCVRTGDNSSENLPVGTSTYVPLGSWSVTCTASDSAGNTTTGDPFALNVVDTAPPTLNVSGLAATISLAPGAAGPTLTYDPTVVTAIDVVDQTLTVVCTPPSGTVVTPPSATIECSVTDSSNNTASASYTFPVETAATTTTVTVMDATYDGNPHGGTATVTGPGGLNAVVSIEYTGTGATVYGPTGVPPTGAGTYAATATYDGTTGYSGSTDTKTFTIAKAPTTITVTCDAGSFSYTGAAQMPCTATVTGAAGLNEEATVTYANNVNAGTATASASYAEAANYLSSTGSTTFTIGKAQTTTTVTCTGAPFVYSGAAQTPCAATVAGAGGLNEPVTVSYADNVNAGTATATAAYVETGNYLASSDTETFEIAKGGTTVTVTCAADTFVYSGAAQTPCSATYAGAGGLSGTLTPTYSGNVYVGTATASATYTGDANHDGGSASATFAISPKPASVTPLASAKVYGTADPALTGTLSGFVASDGVTAVFARTPGEPVGTYTITAVLSPAGVLANYAITANTASFVISKATPVFANLSAPTISVGTASTILAGALRAGTVAPSGSVSITLNGVTQLAPLAAGTGAFSATFDTGALSPVGSPYTIRYEYATGDANFNAAAPASTNLAVSPLYGFAGFSMQATANQGSVVPITWTYTLNGLAVDTGSLLPMVRVRALTSCNASGVETGAFSENKQAPGNSNFQYSTSTFQWKYNWQTKPFAAGCYNVYIRLWSGSGVIMQDNGPYKIQLRK